MPGANARCDWPPSGMTTISARRPCSRRCNRRRGRQSGSTISASSAARATSDWIATCLDSPCSRLRASSEWSFGIDTPSGPRISAILMCIGSNTTTRTRVGDSLVMKLAVDVVAEVRLGIGVHADAEPASLGHDVHLRRALHDLDRDVGTILPEDIGVSRQGPQRDAGVQPVRSCRSSPA